MNDGLGLTSFQLKCIAILTMVIDHTGAVLFPGQMLFRYIGRIAFPVFAFLLTEGFFHTRDVRNYMMRLGMFALLSEVPYDLAFRNTLLEFSHQNVFFTLFIGLAMMYAMEKSPGWAAKIPEALLAMWAAELLCSDYGCRGILLILVFYLLRGSGAPMLLLGVGWNLIFNRSVQMYGALAMIPVAMYNGERGPSMKYFFYVFYPAHLLLLYAAARVTGVI